MLYTYNRKCLEKIRHRFHFYQIALNIIFFCEKYNFCTQAWYSDFYISAKRSTGKLNILYMGALMGLYYTRITININLNCVVVFFYLFFVGFIFNTQPPLIVYVWCPFCHCRVFLLLLFLLNNAILPRERSEKKWRRNSLWLTV